MHKRFLGLLRDAWYAAAAVVLAGVVFWIMFHAVLGVVTIVLGAITFAYFAFMRYDDDGRERETD